MSQLKELIDKELQNRDSAEVSVQTLYQAVQWHLQYTRLVSGVFAPDVGVIGEWSPEEKQVVRDIVDARKQEHSLDHEFGRAMTGYDDPNVETHKAAYQTLERMKPGDIARVHVGQSNYLLAAFPAEMLATSLVLFIK